MFYFHFFIIQKIQNLKIGGIAINNKIFSSLKYKLEDWEEYTKEDKPHPRGELCVKSDKMIAGKN